MYTLIIFLIFKNKTFENILFSKIVFKVYLHFNVEISITLKLNLFYYSE